MYLLGASAVLLELARYTAWVRIVLGTRLLGANRLLHMVMERKRFLVWAWTALYHVRTATLAYHQAVHFLCSILGPSEVRIMIYFLL